jgi:hypothetical protein
MRALLFVALLIACSDDRPNVTIVMPAPSPPADARPADAPIDASVDARRESSIKSAKSPAWCFTSGACFRTKDRRGRRSILFACFTVRSPAKPDPTEMCWETTAMCRRVLEGVLAESSSITVEEDCALWAYKE